MITGCYQHDQPGSAKNCFSDPREPVEALIALPLILLGLAWLQELVDQLIFGGRWNLAMGPGTPWWSLFTAPFSHQGFGHLIANSLVFLPLSYLVLARSQRAYLSVWIAVIVMEIPIWLFWPVGAHGLSGVVYGLLGYLVLIGFLERRPLPIVLSIIALLLYGSALPGLLPWASPAGVSWIGHASGFVGGLLAALSVHRAPAQLDD
ncbi:Rhomboid family protein [Synechococcus sp. MIT S9509]|nr:Rhomboid family protein [Synechococcus sp. MIT S9504]KZR92009.1 Rhomboid family protein [Synechococcus sp. MIT S9509]